MTSHTKRITFRELHQIIANFPKQATPMKYRKNIACTEEKLSITDKKRGKKSSYNITIQNLEIKINDEDLITQPGKAKPGMIVTNPTDKCFIKFENNHVIDKTSVKSPSSSAPFIGSDTVELRNNTLNKVKLILVGSTIILADNTETDEGTITVASSKFHRNNSQDDWLECILAHNKFHEFLALGKGRLDMFAENTIKMWSPRLEHNECKEFDWFIGPKLRIGYPEGQIFYFLQVRRAFMHLYELSIKREDKLQQKYIRSELSRLDFHLFKATATTRSDRIDLLARGIIYFAKLQFADRYFIVKFLLWSVAVTTALTSPVGPFEVIFGLDIWGEIRPIVYDWLVSSFRWGFDKLGMFFSNLILTVHPASGSSNHLLPQCSEWSEWSDCFP